MRDALLLIVSFSTQSGICSFLCIASHQEKPENHQNRIEGGIKTKVNCESLAIAWSIRCLEDLRRGHISCSPENEGHGESRGFLGLASNVAGDQREDQIALGKIELRAVKGNEQADSG